MSLGPGRRLGPYEVLGPLGAVGMGEVWRARDTRLGRDVALKVLLEPHFLFDVSPDGQHFVMIEKDPFELRPLELVVVPGWIEEMRARLAAAK